MENVHDSVILVSFGGRLLKFPPGNAEGEMAKKLQKVTMDARRSRFGYVVRPALYNFMGWPDVQKTSNATPNFNLATGYDIIFFWVSRMIFQSLEFTRPSAISKNVLSTVLSVMSKDGKMSKSSVTDWSDDVIEKYGADASVGSFQMVLHQVKTYASYEKMDASWNFINKIWNISLHPNNEGLTWAQPQMEKVANKEATGPLDPPQPSTKQSESYWK